MRAVTLSKNLTFEESRSDPMPADGDCLTARGRVIKPGRTLIVSRADVMVHKDGRETLCATLLQTLMAMHGRKDEA